MNDSKTTPPVGPQVQPKTPTLTVGAIMTASVISISPDMTIREGIKLLLTNKISGAPVIDSSRKVMTVVSEGDLLKLAASSGLEKTIFQNMTKLTKTNKLLTVKKTDNFADAYKKFLNHPVHRLIVVNDMGRLDGIITRSTILRVLVDIAVTK
jgi:predicted transcriptional regulator